jgi:hypothetical protein
MPRHVNVLGLLYLVWGGLFLLAGTIVLTLTFGAVALIQYAAGEAGTELAAGLTAATFGTLAAIALAWGGIHALPARRDGVTGLGADPSPWCSAFSIWHCCRLEPRWAFMHCGCCYMRKRAPNSGRQSPDEPQKDSRPLFSDIFPLSCAGGHMTRRKMSFTSIAAF